jgi:hypothetical protein
MSKLLKKLWQNEDGNFGVLGAIGTSAILATTALAVDSSSLYNSKASIQSALDAATLAAAYGNPGEYDAIATEVFDGAIGLKGLKDRDVTVIRNGDFLEGRASGTASAFFGGILMPANVNIGVFSKVGFSREVGGNTEEEIGVRACIISLKEDNQGLVLNSGSRINAPDCEVHVHAQQTPVSHNSGAKADISKLCIAGPNFGNNNARGNSRLDSSQVETSCDVAPDPYVGAYPEYNAVSCDYNNFNPDSLGNKKSRNNMQPGVYCGFSNFNNGGGVYTLDPGVYVIKNGGWNVNGGNTLIGEGVTVYYEDRSVVQFNNGASLDISAPTSGDYANFIMVEKPGLNNPNRFVLNGGNHMTMTGLIHLPNRDVTLNSGSRNTSTGIVAQQIIVNSGARLNIVPANYFPSVPGETYDQVPVEGEGQGNASSDNADVERVASSDGVPYLVR